MDVVCWCGLPRIYCMWKRIKSCKIMLINSWKKLQTYLNPFPHTIILQQTTLNLFCQNIGYPFNYGDFLWQKVENIVTKGEIAHFCAISSFVTIFSKSRLLQRRWKASIQSREVASQTSHFEKRAYQSMKSPWHWTSQLIST